MKNGLDIASLLCIPINLQNIKHKFVKHWQENHKGRKKPLSYHHMIVKVSTKKQAKLGTKEQATEK